MRTSGEAYSGGEVSKVFNDAIEYAKKAHEGQTRKGSDVPYIEHPLEVADIVKTMTDDEAVWAAAVLHDTVEDTAISIEDIEREFGKRIADLVASDTENKRSDLPAAETWKIRKQETIDHLNKTDDVSEKMIVLADKLSNIRQIADNYKKIGDLVWQGFNQKDKNEHSWYYKSILEATRELSGYSAWWEYKKLVEQVFG